MTPIALSQLIEQIFRVAVGLYLAYALVGTGLEEAAAGATFGASAGGIAAFILIYIMFIFSKISLKEEISVSNLNKIPSGFFNSRCNELSSFNYRSIYKKTSY